ncbi:MAG: hypothetical protein J3R72DRAFT_438100 [Linnemannia gamsii]|nr:MAG: hypothetical protein J3R72DRAFT_438100 [Linnemannia gamsii]
MARLETLTPTKVQGLPQETTHFPRRFRNKNPLIIRQIVSSIVLEQWSSHPEHVIQALNQTASGAEGVQEEEGEPLLPVMVAEDTMNFMDNPQFTRKIDMTAREIVARVLRPSLGVGEEVTVETDSEVMVPQLEVQDEAQQVGGGDVVVPVLALVESASSSSSSLPLSSSVSVSSEPESLPSAAAAGNICPLCDHQDSATSTTTTQDKDNRRFYYRGMVPPTLYTSLNIPSLLSSLSLPTTTTPFANAPNKDLMRIWVSLAGATTPLHYDRCHGILIQLVGRKRFVVFSHEDTHGLYPYDGISGPGHASKVRGLGHCFPFPPSSTSSTSSSSSASTSASNKEYQQHLDDNMAEVQRRWPKIRNTTPWIVDLEPGDALYTPLGFWHEVTSVDHSISITVPWDMDADELQSVPRHMI